MDRLYTSVNQDLQGGIVCRVSQIQVSVELVEGGARERTRQRERRKLFWLTCESRLPVSYYFASKYFNVFLPGIKGVLLLNHNITVTSKKARLFPEWYLISSPNTKAPGFL